MKTKGFFARVSVVLAIVLAQSVAQDSQDLGANQMQNVADFSPYPSLRTGDLWIASANQDLPRNDKVEADLRDSSVNQMQDSSNSTFAPPPPRAIFGANGFNKKDFG